jgi:RNA polymerase sigma factor for flagellar operon FliA
MEAYKLWQEYYVNKEAEVKEKLIIHYISLVQKIAQKMAFTLPPHLEKEDLYSHGIFGFLEAIDRYNPQLGIPFSAFAVKRIKGAIIDGIRREDWLPVSVRKKAKLLEEAYQKLEMELGRNATDQEIAAALNIKQTELNDWLKAVQFVTVLSLDESLCEEEAFSLKDSLVNSESPNPALIAEEKEIKGMLLKVLEELPEKERLVISLFYYHDLSNKEIAKVLELSESRISQLHTKAIFRMRGKLSRLKKRLEEG